MYFKATNAVQKTYYRSVFLSDFHMGAKSFDAAALLDFLNKTECRYLFLAGDIIDGWKLNKRWYWTKDCSRVIEALVKKRDEGTKIIYLPGNHDDEIRRFLPLARNEIGRRLGIKIKEKAVHTMANGQKFLVLHGDQFDRKILRGPLSKWGDSLYDWITESFGLHQKAPQVLIKGRLKPFSLAKSLNKHGQWALYLLNNFETAAYKMAQQYGVQGLICGHTHIPAIKHIKDITFANAGSWLNQGHTALVETADGNLTLVDWPSSHENIGALELLYNDRPSQVRLIDPKPEFSAKTQLIIRLLKEVWPEKRSDKLEYAPPPRYIVEIQGRDRVRLNTQNIGIAYRPDKRPINLATKIFLRMRPKPFPVEIS